MSTKTSSGVPRVIILATLVTRLAKDLFVCANDLLIETTAAIAADATAIAGGSEEVIG